MAGCHFKSIQRDINIPEFTPDAWAATGNQDWRSDVGLIDQRTALRPNPQSLTLLSRTIRRRGASDWDMQSDPEESDSRVGQKRMLEQIVAIPATLYLPTTIVPELNEICQSLRYTPEQLVIEVLKGQIERVLRPRDDFAGRTRGFCLAQRSCVLFSVCHNCPYYK